MARSLRTNQILVIALVVLGGGAALKAFVFKRTGDTGESAQAAASLFATLKKDDITALLIETPEGKRFELAKDGDHWNVVSEGGVRADQADVNKALDSIAKLKKGRVQSTSLEKLATYGLDDAHATRITVWGKEGRSGAPVAAFALGKIESDWRNAFLKLPDEKAIRKVEASVTEFEPGADNTWRDKTMYDLGPADKIAQIEITGPKGPIVMAREKVMGPPDGKSTKGDAAGDPTATDPPTPAPAGELEVKETVWNLVEPQQARAKKWLCDSIAGYVAKLECDSFGAESDKAAEIGLDPPQYVIKVKREDESEAKAVLLIGNKSKDGKYAVKLPDLPDKPQPQIWWIASWKGDYLTKPLEELLETPPAKPGENPPAENPPAENPPAEQSSAPTPADEPAKPDDGGGR